MDTTASLLAYWYFHLPNFILAALMYTMLGRFLLGLMVDADSPNYIWRFFCRITDPVIAVISVVTPKVTAPAVVWLFGFVWMFWLRVILHYTLLLLNLAPRISAERRHEPQLLFHRHRLLRNDQRHLQPALADFCAALCPVVRRPLLFGSLPLTLMFASLMVSTATIILGGIPAAIYERVTGASESTDVSLWIWLAATALLALPAAGNFLRIGL